MSTQPFSTTIHTRVRQKAPNSRIKSFSIHSIVADWGEARFLLRYVHIRRQAGRQAPGGATAVVSLALSGKVNDPLYLGTILFPTFTNILLSFGRKALWLVKINDTCAGRPAVVGELVRATVCLAKSGGSLEKGAFGKVLLLPS